MGDNDQRQGLFASLLTKKCLKVLSNEMNSKDTQNAQARTNLENIVS